MQRDHGSRRIIISIVRSFFRHGCPHLAANMAFCALLALIPLAMIMISVAGFLLGSGDGMAEEVVSNIVKTLPVLQAEISSNIHSLIDQKSSLGIVGVLFLLFIATILMASVERSLDIVFQSVRRRNFFHSRLLGIVVIFFISVVFFIPTMVHILEGLLQRYGFSFPLRELFDAEVFLLVTTFFSYTVTAVIVPNRKVYIRYALLGGLFFSIGIAVAKYLFDWYMFLVVARYNIIYGSLTAVMSLLIWIYYVSVVLLIASEVAAAFQEKKLLHRGERGTRDDE